MVRREPADPRSLERGVRQLLDDKVSGNMVGLWLLIPEHLRLGTWDLLRAWTGRSETEVEGRLALQLVHEAALCCTGLRAQRCLSQRGFELAHGLPFVASDQAIHGLLDAHTVCEAQNLQISLGLLRKARGHFRGHVLAIDPHRLRSYSKRQMVRYRGDDHTKPYKVSPCFFCLDTETRQPLCFTLQVSAKTVSQVTPDLLRMAALILNPRSSDPADDRRPLVLADTEHFTSELLDHVAAQTPFDLLVPMPCSKEYRQRLQREIPDETFVRHWAGLASAQRPYALAASRHGPYRQYIQRSGETPDDYHYQAFLGTSPRGDIDSLTRDYPTRWHIKEFFNAQQVLGWKRAGTHNLNIRYGHMTMALIAQAAISQLRSRLGAPYAQWDAAHFAKDLFRGLDGDIRLHDNTIIVTYYNAPNADALRKHYANLPTTLARENVNPAIPWLYGLKLDFRFK